MHNLNSILIEGTVTGAVIPEPGEEAGYFRLLSMGYKKVEGERVEFPIIVDVKVENRLAQVCSEFLEEDRGVRIVGRLEQEPDKKLYILAEHVEFKEKR